MHFSIARLFMSTTNRFSFAFVMIAGLVAIFPEVPRALRWPARITMLCALYYLIITSIQMLRRVRWSFKGVLFSSLLLAMIFAAVHILCLLFMRVMSMRDDRLALRGETALSPGGRSTISQLINNKEAEGGFHPTIGWVPRVGVKGPGMTINEHGFRGTHAYPLVPPDRSRRILCMGDSFTFGVGVDDYQTYPHHAEQLRLGSEWLNFGIAGGCLTQAYLHYMENARKFDGHHVIIGFMTNDAQRTVNCYRPFVNRSSGMAMTKPYAFIDQEGKFSIQPNPYTSLADYQRLLDNDVRELRKLLRLDYLTWGRRGSQVLLESPMVRTVAYGCNQLRLPGKLEDVLNDKLPISRWFKSLAAGDLYGDEFWAEESKGFQALCRMFDLFHSTVVKDGRIPLIVIIPGPHDIDDYKSGNPRQYETLKRYLVKRDYRFLDFLDPLLAKHRDDLSEESLFVRRHYQGHMNKELAGEIIKALKLP